MDLVTSSLDPTVWAGIAALVTVLIAVVVVVVVGSFRRRVRPAPTESEAPTTQLPSAPPDSVTVEVPASVSTPRPDLLLRLSAGLARTRDALSVGIEAVFQSGKMDESAFEALEEALISADVGVKVAMKLTEGLRQDARRGGLTTTGELRLALRDRITALLSVHDSAMASPKSDGPLVVLVVGINGGGKTTTVGKLAARYKRAGQRVLLGAGDTFRAGAIAQLRVWAEERAGVEIVAHKEGSDAAAVLFDAVKAGVARGYDVVLCDTAGRLQTRGPLMDELAKVARVLAKARPGAPDEVLLVLDATIGQNALSQARLFGEAVGVTGIVLTKLDGTAKGGVVVAVCEELGLPVKFIGVGEQVDDLRPFDAEAFASALVCIPDR